jgi:hypothetical protein
MAEEQDYDAGRVISPVMNVAEVCSISQVSKQMPIRT